MNITFIIGNGFDLNLGMCTKYLDFLESDIAKVSLSNNKIFSIYQEDKNKYSIDTWADTEKRLGEISKIYHDQMTNEFKDSLISGNVDRFIRDKEQIESVLMDYLIEEQEKIDIIDEKQIAKEMSNTLSTVFEKATPDEQSKILRVVANNISDIVYLNFITFNYTDVLDRIIEACKKQGGNRINNFLGTPYRKVMNEDLKLSLPLHVHGTVFDQPIIGVNDKEQISDEHYLDDDDFRMFMIKEETAKANGSKLYEKAEKIIDASQIIVVYGMSFGETDKRWWEYLAKWAAKLNNILVLTSYDPNYEQRRVKTNRLNIKTRERIKVKMIKDISLDTDVEMNYMGNSIAIVNPSIFNFKKSIIRAKNTIEENVYI